MGLVHYMVSRTDYNKAKQYIIDLTNKYAVDIIPPGVTFRVMVGDLLKREGWDRGYDGAATYGNKEWTKSMTVYDSNLVKANTYNIKSRFFDALVIHELCHARHGFEEPDAPRSMFHKSRKYIECIKMFGEPWMASSGTHPGRYSYRAYLGSEDKVVPDSISRMIFYKCPACGHAALWSAYAIGAHPSECESCHSKNIEWTLLSPFDTYRVAVMNGIDTVKKSTPARFFIFDRMEF